MAPAATPLPVLRTTCEAAAILGLRPGTLEQWRWLGKGPRHVKVGGLVRYSDTALREYIEAQTRASSATQHASTAAMV